MDDETIELYDATIPELLIPPVTPIRNRIPRAEYCNVCENFPCLGGHPSGV